MRALVLSLLLLLPAGALAQELQPPRRQIPPSVLAELAAVEDRFEAALSLDCDPSRCFSKGCTYVAHAVADRPAAGSLPGLGFDPGPGSIEPQAWLTQARCNFAYEDGMDPAHVQALARRLQSRASAAFAVVSVGHQALPPLPPELTQPIDREDAEAEAPEAAPPPAPEPLTASTAARELWTSLLDDFGWMALIGVLTLAVASLIWSWRRLGKETLEEKALLAELAGGSDETAPPASTGAESAPADTTRDTARQATAWRVRLQAVDLDRPDPELQAMIRQLLLAGELPLLAKAVLTFPETLPALFPVGGDVAGPKVALAEYLRSVDPAALPSDAELFRALDRHAISAALDTQRDARVVRSLRDEFGATGLVTLLAEVPARIGALLFALAPAEVQHEMARLLSPGQTRDLCERLLTSNRMAPDETSYVFALLEAARAGEPLPEPPAHGDLSDHGAPFDATAALSLLLPRLSQPDREELFARVLRRFGGSLPDWYRGILVPDMLLELSEEARADLFLGVEAEALAAWNALLDTETSEQIFASAPRSLRASMQAATSSGSRAEQLALADRARRALAAGLQSQLARDGVPFEQVFRTMAAGWA